METVTDRCEPVLIEPRPDLAVARGATSAAWDDILTDIDREVMARGGYGKARGLPQLSC